MLSGGVSETVRPDYVSRNVSSSHNKEAVVALTISLLAFIAAWRLNFAGERNPLSGPSTLQRKPKLAHRNYEGAGWDRLSDAISPLTSVDIWTTNPQPVIAELRAVATSLLHLLEELGPEIGRWLNIEIQCGLLRFNAVGAVPIRT